MRTDNKLAFLLIELDFLHSARTGMVTGIVQSAVFCLVLTKGVMKRPFVHLEIRTALVLKKKIVLVRTSRAHLPDNEPSTEFD